MIVSPDLLETIVAATRRRVELHRARVPRAALERQASQRPLAGNRFRSALDHAGRINIIAECKRRSPSRGVLRTTYNPVSVAKGYEQGGAVALSILTEPTFFDGALEHLAQVRDAVTLPLLRKDFIIDEYQLLEARASGADAVLLIVAALSDRDLTTLQRQARALGLASLVEVHDVSETKRALAAGADIVGVNNRNLRTLDVDPLASERLAEHLPTDVVAVSESGLRTAEDLCRLQALGYRGFLIGERFMTAPAPGEALRALLASVASASSGPDGEVR